MFYRDLSGNGPGGVETAQEFASQLLRFERATVNVFGRDLYPSVQTFNLANGDRLDIDAMLMNVTGVANAQGIWVGDGVRAIYMLRAAASSDVDLGRYSGGDASLAPPPLTTGAFEGLNSWGMTVVPYTGGTRILGRVEGRTTPPTTYSQTGVSIIGGPVRVYLLNDDIVGSRVYAKQW